LDIPVALRVEGQPGQRGAEACLEPIREAAHLTQFIADQIKNGAE
jgi:hypothetical protein